MTSTREKLSAIVHKEVERVALNADEDFDRPFGDLGIDSLDLMTILLEIQERLGVRFADTELDRLHTLGEIADEIDRRLGNVS